MQTVLITVRMEKKGIGVETVSVEVRMEKGMELKKIVNGDWREGDWRCRWKWN